MEHLSPDEHLPLALQVILPLLIICITECGHNFSAALLPELEALTGDQGGRVVLRRHWDRCILLPAEDPLELVDADTPEALLALRQGESDTLKSY